RALNPVHHGSCEAHSRVAPVFLVLRVAGPLVRDAISPRIRDTAVDDRELAMIAVVEPSDIGEADWMEVGDVRAGLLEHLLYITFQLAAARAVDEQAHFNTLSRLFSE